MSIITTMRQQKAIYWAPGSNDGMGKQVFADGVIIDCRWEDIEAEITNKDGDKITSRSTVYVDRDVSTDGFLAYYDGSSPLITDNPETIKAAFRIMRFDNLPNLSASEYLKTAYL